MVFPGPATAAATKAVVAIFVESSPADCVGEVGSPVRAGESLNTTSPVPVVPLTVVPCIAATVAANVPLVVTSPDKLPFVIDVEPENFVSAPEEASLSS